MPALRRHRHLLVLPCCILAALVPAFAQRSAWQASVAVPASTQQSWLGQDVEAPVALQDDSWAFLTPGTRLAGADGAYVMQSGSMTFRTRDPLRITTDGGWTVLAWHGAGQVTVGTKITVAALRSPLLLAKNGHRLLLAPETSVSLPLGGELPGPELGWCAWMTAVVPEPLPGVVLLEQAKLLRGLPEDADERTPEEVAWLAQAGGDDIDLWMLLSVHPESAGMAWLAGVPEGATVDDTLQRIVALPTADRGRMPVPPLAVDRALESLQPSMLAYGEGERLAFIAERFATGAEQLRSLGFPERAERYAAAAQAVRSSAARFQVLPAVTCVATQEDTAEVATPSISLAASLLPSAPPDPPLSADAVRQRLSELGALLTRDSSITPSSDGTIDVVNVLFVRGTEYRTFRLLLDGQAQTALRITERMQTYPNAMPLDRFALWAKGE